MFSSDYSVLSSKAHEDDKKVMYKLVSFAAIVTSNISSHEKRLNELQIELDM